MQGVIKELQKRNVPLNNMEALEVFGGVGEQHTRYYARFVSSLEIWEIHPECAESLRAIFPLAEIKIVDSYQEIRSTSKKYAFISIDNSPSGPGHCEHFDLFPDVFRLANDSAILILNVIPKISPWLLRLFPYLHEKERQLACRASFYKTGRPENIPLDELVAAYRRLARESGFDLEWHFLKSRNSLVRYLVLKVQGLDPKHKAPSL